MSMFAPQPAPVDTNDVDAVRALAVQQRQATSDDFSRRSASLADAVARHQDRVQMAQRVAATQAQREQLNKAQAQTVKEVTRSGPATYAGGQAGTGPAAYTGGKGGPAQFESALAEATRIGGLTPSQANALRTIARYESGFQNVQQHGYVDVNTYTHPANGYVQMIEPTFRSNAMAGYTDYSNPVHQLLSAANYARRKYGSLESVAAKFDRQGHGGY